MNSTPAPPATIRNQQGGELLHDIEPPLPLPATTPYLQATITAVIVLLVVSSCYLLWRRCRREAPPTGPSPAEEARQQLATARQQFQTVAASRYASELSTIIRSYLERTLSQPTTPRTTGELLHDLENGGLGVDAELLDRLGPFLRACDLMKFSPPGATSALPSVTWLSEEASTIITIREACSSPPELQAEEGRP